MTPDGSYFAVQGISTATGEPARLIHLYDGLTGKPVGSIPTTVPPNDWATSMRFDPKGTRLYVQRDVRDRDRSDIFEIPSLKVVGMATGCAPLMSALALGLVASAITRRPAGNARPERTGPPRALLRFVRDVRVSGEIKFSPDSNYLVWGNQDGTVTVCDLNEVQRRLAGVGLGWGWTPSTETSQ